MSNKYLFLFTLGPVQSYIQQSRKTDDLFASSQILSLLSSYAMKAIKERNMANDILFPNYYEDDKNPSYPNRCIAMVEEADIAEMGEYVEQYVRNSYEKLVGNYVGEAANSIVLREHLQIYWVFAEYHNNYIEAYNELEESMEMVKNLRTFEQNNSADYKARLEQNKRSLRKCNLCGERFVLHYNSGKKYNTNYRLASYEGLCEVCLLKRMYRIKEESEEGFPSTSRIALSYWIKEMSDKTDFEEKYKQLKNLLGEEFSDEILYGNLLAFDKKTENYMQVKQILKEIFKNQQKIDVLKRRYYALLVFDGDNMGKWVSGAFFTQKMRDSGYGQKEVSRLLGEYAKWTKSYLHMKGEELGCVVYAGGDDFFGFVPLDHLFEVLQTLRQQFEEMINKQLLEYKSKEKVDISFSAGICIAHYKTPLDKVITEARNQEDVAKNHLLRIDDKELEKNAFSISLLKRSGEHITSSFSFKSYTGNDDVLSILNAIKIKMDNFSVNFIRVLDKEWSGRETKNFMSDRKDMILSETKRLLGRSCINKGQNDKEVEELFKEISQLYLTCCAQEDKFQNFISMLYIIEFLGRELNDN